MRHPKSDGYTHESDPDFKLPATVESRAPGYIKVALQRKSTGKKGAKVASPAPLRERERQLA